MAKPPPPSIGKVRMAVNFSAQSWDEKNGRDKPNVSVFRNEELTVLRIATVEDCLAHGFVPAEGDDPPWICRNPRASGVHAMVVPRKVIAEGFAVP
jgi:hypothetical protein